MLFCRVGLKPRPAKQNNVIDYFTFESCYLHNRFNELNIQHLLTSQKMIKLKNLNLRRKRRTDFLIRISMNIVKVLDEHKTKIAKCPSKA